MHLCPLACSFMLSCFYFSHQTFWHSIDVHTIARSNTEMHHRENESGKQVCKASTRCIVFRSRELNISLKTLPNSMQGCLPVFTLIWYHIVNILYPFGWILNLDSPPILPSVKCLQRWWLHSSLIENGEHRGSAAHHNIDMMAFVTSWCMKTFTAGFLCRMGYIT